MDVIVIILKKINKSYIESCDELATHPGCTLAFTHRVTGFCPSNPATLLKKGQ